MASRRLTGSPAARLAAMRRMCCSLPETVRLPRSRAVSAASQSMSASGVPSLMLGSVVM